MQVFEILDGKKSILAAALKKKLDNDQTIFVIAKFFDRFNASSNFVSAELSTIDVTQLNYYNLEKNVPSVLITTKYPGKMRTVPIKVFDEEYTIKNIDGHSVLTNRMETDIIDKLKKPLEKLVHSKEERKKRKV